MTSTAILVFVIIAMVLWKIHEDLQAKHQCRYCGVWKGHRPDCPYNMKKQLWESKKS